MVVSNVSVVKLLQTCLLVLCRRVPNITLVMLYYRCLDLNAFKTFDCCFIKNRCANIFSVLPLPGQAYPQKHPHLQIRKFANHLSFFPNHLSFFPNEQSSGERGLGSTSKFLIEK